MYLDALLKLQVEASAKAEEESAASASLYVVDETNLLAPSTEKYLERLLKKLQADTGLKLRALLSCFFLLVMASFILGPKVQEEANTPERFEYPITWALRSDLPSQRSSDRS